MQKEIHKSASISQHGKPSYISFVFCFYVRSISHVINILLKHDFQCLPYVFNMLYLMLSYLGILRLFPTFLLQWVFLFDLYNYNNDDDNLLCVSYMAGTALSTHLILQQPCKEMTFNRPSL